MNSDMPPITRGSSVLRPAMFALSIGACLCGCQLDLNAVGNPEHAPNLASLSVVAEATADAGRPETVDRDLHQAVIDDFVQQYETMNATDLIGANDRRGVSASASSGSVCRMEADGLSPLSALNREGIERTRR
jgi:hypothetical protein